MTEQKKERNKLLMDIGDRIRMLREQKGMSQEELAWNAQISPSYIKKIERGNRRMSIEVLVKILDSLDTSADYLLGGDDSYALTLTYLKRISELLDELLQKI